MSARDELFGFVEAGAEEEDLPTFAAAIDAFRAEVLAEGLTDAERTFLTFALGLAADVMASRGDEFTAEDEAALAFLRRMATAPTPPVPDNTTGDEEPDASWLCPNNPLGHRWIKRPFPEVTTPHCALCGRPQEGDR
jgi:hypothetical protein